MDRSSDPGLALWIRNASLVDGRGAYRADLVIRGERVEALGVVRPFGAFEELDAAGLWLIPGRLDPEGGPLCPGKPLRAGSRADVVAVEPAALDATARNEDGTALLRTGGDVGAAVRWCLERGEVTTR